MLHPVQNPTGAAIALRIKLKLLTKASLSNVISLVTSAVLALLLSLPSIAATVAFLLSLDHIDLSILF